MKKSFGGTFTFSNCHIIGLDTVGLVFLVSGCAYMQFENLLLQPGSTHVAAQVCMHNYPAVGRYGSLVIWTPAEISGRRVGRWTCSLDNAVL
jgi:hypothetical protein